MARALRSEKIEKGAAVKHTAEERRYELYIIVHLGEIVILNKHAFFEQLKLDIFEHLTSMKEMSLKASLSFVFNFDLIFTINVTF